MKLLTFKQAEDFALGVKVDGGVFKSFMTPDVFFNLGSIALPAMQKELEQALPSDLLDESMLSIGLCVPNPGKILCWGLNYARHAKESGIAEPKTPVLFSKFNNTIAAQNEDVYLPRNAVEYDYKAELVVVIGKLAKNVSEADALDYVLGYCNGNDISARDLQMLIGQWLLGKTVDKLMPIDPYLISANEVDDPQAKQVRCWLNFELRQDSNTLAMIFSVAQVISYASQYMTLEPSDIITTGTPEGVILGMNPKVWMKPQDETIVEISSLGQHRNRMV